MYDLVIIGSGPAGLSAAVYAKRACLDVVVLEKEPMGGGQMIYTQEVDNYLGLPETNGFDLAQKFEQHAKALQILEDNSAKLHELAKYLYEHETITGEEFMKILNSAPAELPEQEQ